MVIDADGVTARENDDAYIPWAAMFTVNRAAFHFSLAGRALERLQSIQKVKRKPSPKIAGELRDYAESYS